MKLAEKLVIITQSTKTYVLITNDEKDIQIRWEGFCELYGIDPKTPTDIIGETFVKWLVSVHGYARQDDGCDYELLHLPSYSTD